LAESEIQNLIQSEVKQLLAENLKSEQTQKTNLEDKSHQHHAHAVSNHYSHLRQYLAKQHIKNRCWGVFTPPQFVIFITINNYINGKYALPFDELKLIIMLNHLTKYVL